MTKAMILLIGNHNNQATTYWIDSIRNFVNIRSQQLIKFGFTFLRGFPELQSRSKRIY